MRRGRKRGIGMWKTVEGSTGRLIQLCLGYFFFYTFFGVASKYFPGSAEHGLPGMSQVAFLVYSTIGGTAVALFVVLAWRWYRLKTIRPVRIGRLSFPSELLYIIPSGIFTAVVIPTTTLMYLLVSSVMVAMVIMRGTVVFDHGDFTRIDPHWYRGRGYMERPQI